MSIRAAALACGLTLLTVACNPAPAARPIAPSSPPVSPTDGGSVRHFDLTAEVATLTVKPGLSIHAWTYNGSVPGPTLRVRAGDVVEVSLHNQLPEGTTLHWHGLAVPNGEDGVAGVTQDPVPPGDSVTYRFLASNPGTFWYHSHQDSASQVDRGLYGALVVDPRDPSRDATDTALVYDEWPLALEEASPPPPNDYSWVADVTFSVNGKTGAAIEPVRVRPGQLARLRLVNAGYFSHFIYLDEAPWRVVALDGHEVTDGPATDEAVAVGPGERVDVEFTAPDHPMWLRLLDGMPPAADIIVPVVPEGAVVPVAGPAFARRGIVDLATYPARASDSPWPVGGVAKRIFTLNLSQAAAGHPTPSLDQTLYEINGKQFPNTGTLDVAPGDLVQITFVNHTRMDHPMHLHGHFFQLLAIDGRPPAGVIVKDTVVVGAGQTVSIGFRADNPGWWMLHCHELYHARGGMMVLLRYLGSPRLAQLGGVFHDQPD